MDTAVKKGESTRPAIDRTLLKKEVMRVLVELNDLVERVGDTNLSSEAHLVLVARLNFSVGTLRGKVDELLGAINSLTDESSGLREAHRNLVARLADMTNQQHPVAFSQD